MKIILYPISLMIIACIVGCNVFVINSYAYDVHDQACLSTSQPASSDAAFIDQFAAVLERFRLIRHTTYERFKMSPLSEKLGLLHRILRRPQPRLDDYIKRYDSSRRFLELKGIIKSHFLASVRDEFSDRESRLLKTIDRFIIVENLTQKHYFILETAAHKSDYNIKLDRLAYNIAQIVNDAIGEKTILVPERITVPVEHIESARVQKWARKKGLAEVTLVRFVNDYKNKTHMQSSTAIESHIAFLLLMRDGDHDFSSHNAFWFKDLKTSMLYDFDVALRKVNENIETFITNSYMQGAVSECKWKSIFITEKISTINTRKGLFGISVKTEVEVPYAINYDALWRYARIIASIPDDVFYRCVVDAGFDMKDETFQYDETGLFYEERWPGRVLYERLVKQKGSIKDDLHYLLHHVSNDKKGKEINGEAQLLIAA